MESDMNKIKTAKLVSMILFGLSVAACSPTDSLDQGSSQREAHLAERQKIITGFDDKVAAFKLTMEESRAKLEAASQESRAKYQRELDIISKNFEKASELQQQLKASLSEETDGAWIKAKQGIETVVEEFSHFNKKIEEMFTQVEKDVRDTDRQKIVDQFEAKLADLDSKIAEGKKKVANASADVKTKFEEQLAQLVKKQDAAKDKLNELKQSAKDGTADAWHKIKAGLDTTWDNIYEAGRKLLDSNE